MTIPAYFVWMVIALLAINAIGKVIIIDVPREPVTRASAAFTVLVNGALIITMVLWVLR